MGKTKIDKDIGELECFDKTIGNHRPRWVGYFLRKDHAIDLQFEYARQFVSQIIF